MQSSVFFIRKVFSFLGSPLLIRIDHTRPLHAILPALARRLPLFDHMMFWAPNNLSFVWAACFDLMHAPISYHFSKDEMLSLARDNQLEVQALELTHGTTWSLTGKSRTSAS
ncbi:hypothetical protein ACQZV8_07010 [Magnetococcales bacterium HHB-1]